MKPCKISKRKSITHPKEKREEQPKREREREPTSNKGRVHTMALPFTLKSILRRQKKSYGNSNILPCKNIIFKKNKIL